ncbi:MAG: hypothetical protein J0H00_06055 [Burkholderiales bacterium]|nr:hypothetical protein [Burkholderiales bacterium]
MLDIVFESLKSSGLIRADARFRYNVGLTLGDVLHLAVRCEDDRYYHIRLSEQFDLAQEYASSLRAYERFPEFVPQPLAYLHHRNMQWIVTTGVRAKPVIEEDLLRLRRNSSLHRGLIGFFLRAREQAGEPYSKDDAFGLIEGIDSRFSETELSNTCSRVTGSIDIDSLTTLSHAPQHGDFSVNNLALGKLGLTVFDWEDFGRVTLQGFDLAILVSSMMRFEPMRLEELRATDGLKPNDDLGWIGDACIALGIDFGRFRKMLPLYLLQFLMLKDLYSRPIRRRVEKAILALV